MDDETRAAFARMDRYFELSQAQHEALRGEISELRTEIRRLHDRVDAVEASIAALRTEMIERFIDVDEQVRTLTRRQEMFEQRVVEELADTRRHLATLQEQGTQQGVRLGQIEIGLVEVYTRIDALSADMRQRFRVVNERLGTAA